MAQVLEPGRRVLSSAHRAPFGEFLGDANGAAAADDRARGGFGNRERGRVGGGAELTLPQEEVGAVDVAVAVGVAIEAGRPGGFAGAGSP